MKRFIARLYASPYLILPFTSLLWAGNSIVGKLAIGEIAPMTLTSLRWVAVCLFLWVLRGPETWAAYRALRPRWHWVALMGMLGYTSFNALLYVAAYHTSAVNITILQGSLPVFIIAGGFLVFRTKIGWLQIAGTIVTVLGVAVVASGGDPTRLAAFHFNGGDLYIIAACILYAAYSQGLRNRPDVSGIALFTGFATAALVASIPLISIEIARGDAIWPTPFGWLLLAFVAIGPSFLCQVLYMRGIELIGPARAGLFINLIPVFGALLAVVVLNEPFGLHHGLALALVLGGIVLAEIGRKG
jgi:drug/metabolite transporter (DMT)-like permease